MMRKNSLLAAGAALALLSACSRSAEEAAPEAPSPKGDLVALSDAQVKELGITVEPAQGDAPIPLASVPGTVSLPPEARVAVTSPFGGTAVKVLVIPGQEVARGAVLGVVKAAESVQFSGAMARSQAELPVAQANAARLSQLAKEGVIAPSRAEEAVANLRAVQATLAENRRLLALGGASRDGTVTLRSPIAGRVASVSVETGGAVSTDGAPFVVENIAALRLDLQLPQRLAGQLRPGMPVAVEQDGRRVTGKLLSVGASLDPVTRSLVARASVAGDAGLVPGKGVTAIIEAAGETTKGVSVPRTAVANVDGKDVVFVRDGKNFRRQVVKVAGESSGRMVIGSGLDAHAQVVTKGVAELKAIFAGA
ncbi:MULTISPECIES: efflux RND transporter periplasmic adaptor subunit [unclassified Novosphingobium]|uniref:efflux RND transporter periplasmic adaptor subunit n=1 Tax=unclassified Novosphingobium TaxID=2644732 RepID=UPI000A61DD21|nr:MULTISPECIES: efflux RND transporter periplasmic adaptor subunit [unclassified Novosphingobium]MDR6706790.1 cobalt-zinc-cadmium efflux system membrane fusion protein [Novosphingobium sp. 1748]NKI99462.1 cobalt-zinc-cadmium efflux system membrane fusion protein [Novosphingobium sp. SG707]